MQHRTRWQVPAIVAGTLGCFGASVATAAEPTQQQLIDQIQSLQQQVTELRQNQQKIDATGASTVDSVLRDAGSRSEPLMQASSTDFTAGYKGGKFIIQSPDGKFSLNPNLQFQVRNVTNFRENASTDGSSDRTENGFEIRRAKFAFGGNVFSKSLTYNLQFTTARSGGAVTLEEGWLKYGLSGGFEGIGFRIGQVKDFTFHEETNSSKRQLAVDRSLLNELIGGGQTDFIQAATVSFDKKGPFRAELGLTDGFNSDNNNFQEGGGGSNGQSAGGYDVDIDNANYGVVARAEFLLFGKDDKDTFATAFKQYDDFTAMNNTVDYMVVGAGAHFTNAGDVNAVFHTVDVQFENTTGLSLYAAYVGLFRDFGSDFDTNPSTTAATIVEEGTYYDYGVLVQAGYMLNERVEPFVRYNFTMLDDADASVPDQDSYSEITVGMNYYLRGHAAKFTADANFLPDGVPAAQSGIGYLSGSDESQIAIRLQFQLLI